MRIHHVINSFSLRAGGAERLARTLHLGLRERGIESRLLGIEPSYAEEELEEAHMRLLGCARPYSVRACRGVMAALRRAVRPGDIVHAHLSPSVVYCGLFGLRARLAGKRRGIRLVMTEHSTHNRRRGTLRGRLIDGFIYRSMDHVICISDGVESELHAWMPSTRGKTVVIPNGIALHHRTPPPEPKPAASFRVVSVGRLVTAKNYGNALRAFALLCQQSASGNPGRALPEYLIGGSGPLEGELNQLAAELGVAHQVRFLGQVTDVPALLARCDAFFIPSRWEGFGMAAIEAMNAGLPVVAADVPGLRELFAVDPSPGFLVDPLDVEGLASALERLRDAPGLRRKLGAAGFERSQAYSLDRMVDAHVDFYRQIESRC